MDSVIIFCAKYLFVIIPVLFLLALVQASNKHRKQLLFSVAIALVIAVILDKIAGKLYYDPRPFVTHNVKPLITHAADNGFPSEHTLFTFVISSVIFLYRRRLGTAALVLSLIVGIARIAAHVHSPIDIAGGIIFGAAAGYIGTWLAKNYLSPQPKTLNAAAAGDKVPDKHH